jgi:hypothetical protein
MPYLLDAARVHCSGGEIIRAPRDVWGVYTETRVY